MTGFVSCAVAALLCAATALAATPRFTAGNLTFAPWAERSGVVTFGAAWPPGRWASFYDSGGSDTMNEAVTSLQSFNLFVTAGTPNAPDGSSTCAVKGLNADSGAVQWTYDATPFGIAGFAFVKPLPMGFGDISMDVIFVASKSGRVFLLNNEGLLLGNTTLPGMPATWAAFLEGDAAQPAPLAPFQAFLAPVPGRSDLPIAVVISQDSTTAFILTASPGGATLTLAASIGCGQLVDGSDSIVLAALHRGMGRIVVHCQTRVVEYDVLSGAQRTVVASITAITTIEHSAAGAQGAPIPAVAQAPSLQDVYFAAYSSLENAVAVGTLGFGTGAVNECTTIRTDQVHVKAIRVLASNATKALSPSPAVIIVQTASGLLSIVPSATGRCPWAGSWDANYETIESVGAALQHRTNTFYVSEVGAITVVSTRSETALLLALRLSTNMYLIDATNRAIVWSETLATDSTSCYQGASPTPVNPFFVSIGPAKSIVLLGCPSLYYVVQIPDMTRYGPGSISAIPAGSVPPFYTQAGHAPVSNVVDAPALLADTMVTAHSNRLTSAHAFGMSYSVTSTYTSAQLDGVVFTMNAKGDQGTSMIITAVGASGQDIWRREDIPNTQKTSGVALQPFGPYLLVAVQGWHLHVLNASSGASVTRFSMPFECTAGQGNNFDPLLFEHFVAMDPDFATHQASGLPGDPTVATAVVFSFGTCEYAVDRGLSIRLLSKGVMETNYAVRVQLSPSIICSVTSDGLLSLYDLSNTSSPTLMWRAQPQVLSIQNYDTTPVLQLHGNVLVIANANQISALLAGAGLTLWIDSHTAQSDETDFFNPQSLGVYGNTAIVTTTTSVAGYDLAPQPVDPSVPQNTANGSKQFGTAPQQVRWRQFLANFSNGNAGTGRLTQYGRYIVTTGLWVAALEWSTGAVVWRTTLPPASWGPYPQGADGFENMLVAQNIAVIATQANEDTMWQIDESSGDVLQMAMSSTVFVQRLVGTRVTFSSDNSLPSIGRGSPLTIVTWPTVGARYRVLPLPPPVPARPATHVTVPPHYQRPTYAPPTRAPIPELVVDTNTTTAPPLKWSVPWDEEPNAGVSVFHNALVRFNSDTGDLTAWSLEPSQVMIWSASSCNYQSQGVTVLDVANVAVTTCSDHISGFNLTDGTALWTFKASCNFRVTAISPASPLFAPALSPNTVPLVLAAEQSDDDTTTTLYGLHAVSGTAVWTTAVSCLIESPSGDGKSITGLSLPAARGESSHILPPNVFVCESGTRILVNLTNGNVTFLEDLIAGSTRHNTVAAINPTGTSARFVDAATGEVTASGPLRPPFNYNPGQTIPIGLGLVATDVGRNQDILLELTQDQKTLRAYVYSARSAAFESLWAVSIAHIVEAAGYTGPVIVSRQHFGLSQSEVEEQGRSVIGFCGAGGDGYATDSDVLFRLSLADGSIQATANVSLPGGGRTSFAVFTPRSLDPASEFSGQYYIQTDAYTALVDAHTLRPVYVMSTVAGQPQTFDSGVGTLLPSVSGPLTFIASASQQGGDQATVIGRWALAPQHHALEAHNTRVLTALNDGTGDLLLFRTLTAADTGDTRPLLIRRGAMGADAGVLRWRVDLPPSLSGTDGDNGATLNGAISDTAVVVFAAEGVFFYDLGTGAVTTTIAPETMRSLCPMDPSYSWTVFALEVGSLASSPIQGYSSVGTAQGLILGNAGPCMFMFNAKRELAVYRVPSFSVNNFLNSFGLYVPVGAPPAVTAVFSGTAERWTLPAGFLTPAPHGTPLPVVDYTRRVVAVRSWVANLEVLQEPGQVDSVISSNTLFISDRASVYSVDMHTGTLLWRFSGYDNYEGLPIRVAAGKVFLLSTVSFGNPSLVVLDAFALAPPRRVLKLIPLAAYDGDNTQGLSPVIGGRVIVFQSGVRLLGIDAVTLDLRWNITGTNGPQSQQQQSWIRPVPAARGSPLFGAFIAVPAQSTQANLGVFDAASGHMLASVDSAGQELVLVASTCTANGPGQRCGIVSGAGIVSSLTTFVSLLPTSVAVPHPLPAPAGPAPVSPVVPRGFRFTEPTPKNQPPAPLGVQPGSQSPVQAFPTQLNIPAFNFASNGLVISETDAHIAAVNESTGVTVWNIAFDQRLQDLCKHSTRMVAGSDYVVALFTCLDQGGVLTVVYNVTNGAKVFERASHIATIPTLVAANLGSTVCHTYMNISTSARGVVCFDVSTGAVSFSECPQHHVSELSPNPSRTALVMACSGTYLKTVAVSAGSLSWSFVSEFKTPGPVVAWADPHSPTRAVGFLLSRNISSGLYHLATVDTDTIGQHTWTLDITDIFGDAGLGAATALSVRYVALQSQSMEAVVDMFSRKAVLVRTFPRGRVCCMSLGCCGALRLMGDQKTVISVNGQRGTVISYDVSANTTNWVTDDDVLQYDEGNGFVVSDSAVAYGARAIIVNNFNMFAFNANTGATMWTGSAAALVAAGPVCAWTDAFCISYVAPPTVVTSQTISQFQGLQGRVLVTDGQNIYTLNATVPPAAVRAPQQHYVTPSAAGFSGAFLFGGPDSTRFLISLVNGRNWIFDTEAGMAAVYAFDFPLDSASLGDPRTQSAYLPRATSVAAANGGAAYIPGRFSGVLAVIASTVGTKTTFALKFWQTDMTVLAKLAIYQRTPAHNMPMPSRTCGVVVPLGAGVAVIDCVRMTPWWSTPTPALPQVIAPVVAGDYVLHSTADRLVCSSAITGQTVWRSRVMSQGIMMPPFVWNGTAFAMSATVDGDSVNMFAFSLAFDAARPADMDKAPMSSTFFANSNNQFTFAPGLVLVPGSDSLAAYSLSTNALVWQNDLLQSQDAFLTVKDGTLLMLPDQGAYAVDLRTGNATLVLSFDDAMDGNSIVPIPGTSVVATMVAATFVQLVPVAFSPPLPPAPNGPAYGIPPASYPAASPTATSAPTLAPGAVLPSLGCVSRVVGASENFVTCVNEWISLAYETATWGPGGRVFEACPPITTALRQCGTAYLSRMGLDCPAGADHIKALFANLRSTNVFGTCPAIGTGQCASAAGSAALCDVMKGDMMVGGVVTFKPGQHLAPGFAFPAAPAFAAAPATQSPATLAPATVAPATPAPTPTPTVQGQTTTFAVRYAPAVAPPTAADLGVRLTALLGFPSPVTVHVMSTKGSVASGQWVFFNLTSSNAQEAAANLGRRADTDVAAALGGSQFGLYFPSAVSAPPPPPKDKTDPIYIAAAAVAGALLSAAVVGVVMFIVMRRSTPRAGNGSMAGPASVMSQHELKSLNEGMLGPESPYEQA